MKKILILASNSRGDLSIEREIRDIKRAIKRNKNSDRFYVETELAVTVEYLDELLYDNQPYIVHFCGHGEGKKGLVFQDDEGVEKYLPNKDLSTLFETYGKDIECVLLNACYTEVQADLIVEHIPYVIGTSREILDQAAYYFSVGFYKGLVREQSIEFGYKWGYDSVQRNMPEVDIELYIDEQYRKMEAIEEDNSKVNRKPLKIVLKTQKQRQENLFEEIKFSTNISPELEQELLEEGNRKKYYDKLRNVLDNFGQTIIGRDERILDFELQQRETLVNKVEKFWIEGFLKPSLYFNTATDTNIDHPSGQILRPLDNLEVISFDIYKSYDALQKTDIKGQIIDGKTLLILGEPGSGKTIAVLRLAERLIEQTKQNTKKPIPVVFNLSSWGQKQQPLEEWLIEELKDKYQVPKAWSEPWLRDQQLTLLLDGLDEVKAEHRNACVRAINKFIADDHLETEIVVCSRVKDYEALVERLLLSSVICIQPFSKKQLLDFLENADDSLLGLKTVIEQYREIAEFAQTPLILNMMTWTYHGWSAKKCYCQFRQRKNRELNLFESYIDKNLKREDREEKYPKKKVLDWLSWLAKIMVNESKTIFLIEELQPTLLQSTGEKISYRIRNIIWGGLIVVLIFGLSFSLLTLETGRIFGLSVGFSGGIIGFGSLKEITLFEKINFKWLLSWQKTKSRMILNSILVLIFIVTFGLIQKQITYELLGLFIGVIIYMPTDFLINSVVNSKLKIEERTKPNQGIWLSRNNCIRLGLSGGLIGGLLWGLFIGLIVSLDKNLLEGLKFGFGAGLMSVILIGGLVGLKYGGAACIQHFNLRGILYRKGRIPKDYADFLDYASERLLMKKVGGGYVFYHRMLMEHFAQS